MKHPKVMELENEYKQALASGSTLEGDISGYMNERARAGVKNKITAYLQAQAEREEKEKKKEPHTYGEIVKTISKSKAEMNKLAGEPERLVQEYRVKANKEFDELVENEQFTESNRALWVAGKVEKYLKSEEYLTVKDNLRDATNLFSKCVALKEQWEKDNADIIEAERIRSKREELLSADPETLKALGITPDPSFNISKQDVAGSEDEEDTTEIEKALRSIHPSATEEEIKAMANI